MRIISVSAEDVRLTVNQIKGLLHMVINRKMKLVSVIGLIMAAVLIRVFVLGTFTGVDIKASDVKFAELTIEAEFDKTCVYEEGDIESLIRAINRCESEGTQLGQAKGGYNVYSIEFHLKDDTVKGFKFIKESFDEETGIYHMVKLKDDGEILSQHFRGTLIEDFFEMVKEYNPTDRNMEWYKAVIM